jgi:hypothetical protein
MQSSHIGHMGSQPSYNQSYANTFSQQSPQQEPWSAVGHLRTANISTSDSLLFDPESSMGNMGNDWSTAENFNYLVSPHSQDGYPIDAGLDYANQLSSVDMEFSVSATHQHQVPFVYGQSPSLVSENYIQDPFSRAHSDAASIGAMSRLSSFQAPASPFSAQGGLSPGSEGVFSYQASDPDAIREAFQQVESFHNSPSPAPTSSNNTVPTSQYADPIVYGPEPVRSRTSRQPANKPGGRQLGSHLAPEVAKDAHDMRKVVACWHCVLQRDKVTIWTIR